VTTGTPNADALALLGTRAATRHRALQRLGPDALGDVFCA
jgi:hypothetical protein